jgi:hypothetical protein
LAAATEPHAEQLANGAFFQQAHRLAARLRQRRQSRRASRHPDSTSCENRREILRCAQNDGLKREHAGLAVPFRISKFSVCVANSEVSCVHTESHGSPVHPEFLYHRAH